MKKTTILLVAWFFSKEERNKSGPMINWWKNYSDTIFIYNRFKLSISD